MNNDVNAEQDESIISFWRKNQNRQYLAGNKPGEFSLITARTGAHKFQGAAERLDMHLKLQRHLAETIPARPAKGFECLDPDLDHIEVLAESLTDGQRLTAIMIPLDNAPKE
jgi:hypothetical protein